MLPKNIVIIATKIIKSQNTSYLVGGCIRDSIVGIIPNDFDIVTSCVPSKLEVIFREHNVDLVGKNFGVLIIDKCEVATYRLDKYETKDIHSKGADFIEYANTLMEDLSRRDFTINSMAQELLLEGDKVILGDLVDPFNGQEDIKNKIIRFVGNPEERIKEDPIRMLRACRFAGKLGFNMDFETASSIDHWSHLLNSVSPERVRLELMKMMEVNKPGICIDNMYLLSVLKHVLPELYEVKTSSVDCGNMHKETIYQHCLLSCDAVSKKYHLIRLAALLHDIGKIHTSSKDETGNTHFYCHEVESAKLVDKWLRSLKFSNEEREYIVELILKHMFFFEEITKDSTYRRFMSQLKVPVRDLLRLRMADRRGNLAKIGTPKAFKRVLRTIRRIEKEDKCLKISDLAINGNDLIELGYKPSRFFTEALNYCLNVVLEDPSKNTKEVLIEEVKCFKKAVDGIVLQGARDLGAEI